MALVIALGIALPITWLFASTRFRLRSSLHVRLYCRVIHRGSTDHARGDSIDRRVALVYFRWCSIDHFRLDGRVAYRGSSDHARDCSRDHRVALLYVR